MSVTFTDNTDKVLAELERKSRAALEAVGGQAVSHAKQTVNTAGRVASSNMINSISHKVVGHIVYIGTNVRYAIYNEMGTGIHIAGGRKTPWSYKDAEGNWHTTRGMRPIHFLKNAAANHTEEYKAILKRILSGG